MLVQVINGSCNGWMVVIIEELVQVSVFSDFGVLYGVENIVYVWEVFDMWENDVGKMIEWFCWKVIKLQDQVFFILVEVIMCLFDWFSVYVDELVEDIFSDLCFVDELVDDIY